MISPALVQRAAALLKRYEAEGLRIVTAESCTGGLLAALLTQVPGSSTVVERGFVTYSNEAKTDMLGVAADLIARHGAVSEPVARAMAEGALIVSPADVSIAVTGLVGPGGGSEAKPVGLVHLAAARRGGATLHRQCGFGDIGRDGVRMRSVEAALALLQQVLDQGENP
jgi:nicotinamide-nucleotide amidase